TLAGRKAGETRQQVNAPGGRLQGCRNASAEWLNCQMILRAPMAQRMRLPRSTGPSLRPGIGGTRPRVASRAFAPRGVKALRAEATGTMARPGRSVWPPIDCRYPRVP